MASTKAPPSSSAAAAPPAAPRQQAPPRPDARDQQPGGHPHQQQPGHAPLQVTGEGRAGAALEPRQLARRAAVQQGGRLRRKPVVHDHVHRRPMRAQRELAGGAERHDQVPAGPRRAQLERDRAGRDQVGAGRLQLQHAARHDQHERHTQEQDRQQPPAQARAPAARAALAGSTGGYRLRCQIFSVVGAHSAPRGPAPARRARPGRPRQVAGEGGYAILSSLPARSAPLRWGYSSAGRASGWQPEGQRFEPAYLHHLPPSCVCPRAPPRAPLPPRPAGVFPGRRRTAPAARCSPPTAPVHSRRDQTDQPSRALPPRLPRRHRLHGHGDLRVASARAVLRLVDGRVGQHHRPDPRLAVRGVLARRPPGRPPSVAIPAGRHRAGGGRVGGR